MRAGNWRSLSQLVVSFLNIIWLSWNVMAVIPQCLSAKVIRKVLPHLFLLLFSSPAWSSSPRNQHWCRADALPELGCRVFHPDVWWGSIGNQYKMCPMNVPNWCFLFVYLFFVHSSAFVVPVPFLGRECISGFLPLLCIPLKTHVQAHLQCRKNTRHFQ